MERKNMNSFIAKRLLPFFIFTVTVETLFICFEFINNYPVLDFSVLSVLKTLGVRMLTTTVAFLFAMMPYMLYLLFLPQSKINTKGDKIITTTMYSVFVFISLFNAVASAVFWEEFQSAFNFIAVDYLVYTNEVIANIWQSYPVVPIISAIIALSAVVICFSYKYLFLAENSPRFFKRLFYTATYICICFLSYANIDISDLEISKNRYNNELAKEGFYSLFSAFLKNEIIYDNFYLTQDTTENLAILQKKYQGNNITFISPKKNIARQISSFRPESRANVIIVLMESMSAKYMDENHPQTPSITPNLSKLAQEGLYFSNTYAIGTRSVRGIEALTLSLPPLPGMSVVRRKNNENLHGIGSIFHEKGYDNKWIYGGYGYFDNMNYFMGSNGFKAIDRTDWNKDEITFANAWGASDEDTFNKIISEADKSFAEDKPFLTFTLTISNHRPYTFPEGRIDMPSRKGGRIAGVKYADYAIGKFMENAKQKPWFDNTIFVFIADHTAGASGKEEINLEGHHIPFIIYAPKFVKAQRIDTPVSQIDALPTLLGILNFNYESRFFGQDILLPHYKSRLFVSNYQKIGYVKNGVKIILKPVKEYSVSPEKTDKNQTEQNLKEAIAYYQQASDWENQLKAITAE